MTLSLNIEVDSQQAPTLQLWITNQFLKAGCS